MRKTVNTLSFYMCTYIITNILYVLISTYLVTWFLDKKFMRTFSQTYSNFVTRNFNFGIHGPTAAEVTQDMNLENKTCLITGANSGIGLEMTRCLALRDCNILMACRNTYAASVVAKNVCENIDRIRYYEINLSSLNSVKKCCDKILKFEKTIDMVILNAGVFGLPWTLTEDNLETTYQVNYLSQYYLLTNIEKSLAPDARVVFVSSESHRNVNWSTSDKLILTEEMVSLPKNKYTSIKAYNVSKLCGILAMHNIGYRWLKTEKSVFCAHPGSFVKTKLCRNWWVYELLYSIMRPFSKNIYQAASTPIFCATSPDLKGLSALYYKDCYRCAESELASDFQLSFRMNDLTKEMISSRVSAWEHAKSRLNQTHIIKPENMINESIICHYSG